MHLPCSRVSAALALAAALAASSSVAAQLTRAPYLQKMGPTSVIVAFRTDASCAAQVRYGEGSSTGQVAASPASGRVHAVPLNGLTPGTRYSYSVDTCGSSSPTRSFVTAPAPGTRSVHFAAVGDFGTGGSSQAAVVQSMVKRKPQLMLALGDNAYSSGTEAEFQSNLFVPMAPLLAEVPMFASLGNHEYVTNQGQPYLDNLYLPTSTAGGERYYSFDWGHVHFVALDSNCAIGLASSDRCTLAAQKGWLDQDLASTRAHWKVVFFHHPPWSSGDHGSQLKMRREFAPLFEKHNVDLVLTGHDHNYERSKPMKGDGIAPAGTRGVPYLVVGGGGANLRSFPGSAPSWSAVRNNKENGFLDVTVEDGTLTAQLVTPSGSTIDRFQITKELPPVETELFILVEGQRGVAPHRALFRTTTALPGARVTWDFGDGTSAEGTEVTHTYARAGEYTVVATATATGQVATGTAKVSIFSEGTVLPPEDAASIGELSSSGGAGASGCAAAPAALLVPGALVLVALGRRRRTRAVEEGLVKAPLE